MNKFKILIVILLSASSLALSFHYIDIIHSKDYTGNPDIHCVRDGECHFIKMWHSFFSRIYKVEKLEPENNIPYSE
ncbi:MAG: hypothetical protein JW982_00715 [Spirochaetes bacterium]|nr:hypothetical protein [Spirochaetota bacterium]